MANDELRDYYRGERLDVDLNGKDDLAEEREQNEAQQEAVQAQISPFVAGRKEAKAQAEGPIRPMDWVVLRTDDEFLVGNHPLIRACFKERIPGRVAAVEVTEPEEFVKIILQKFAMAVVGTYRLIHVVFAKEQEKPFIFWEQVVEKVDVRPHSPIVVTG